MTCRVPVRCAEASKVIMQYVAEVSGKGQDIDRVKEQLLQSNPVLEGGPPPPPPPPPWIEASPLSSLDTDLTPLLLISEVSPLSGVSGLSD